MNKVIISIATLAILLGCDNGKVNNSKELVEFEYEEGFGSYYHMIDVEWKGRHHEFLTPDNENLVHWPDCKYCSKNGK